ncbi:putative F-box protein [Salvia divinorum]|uniref:F-box protein n=1 Tax=Salvia divinorum TaxID=28513 RepID=A0ABD1HMM5_SALDI
MEGDFFKCLPSEIVVNILSRLPLEPLWPASVSAPGIAVETHPKSYDVIEFVDGPGFNFDEENPWDVAFNFELPFDEPIHSSANGLIFLRGVDHGDLILCNPNFAMENVSSF